MRGELEAGTAGWRDESAFIRAISAQFVASIVLGVPVKWVEEPDGEPSLQEAEILIHFLAVDLPMFKQSGAILRTITFLTRGDAACAPFFPI